MKKLLFGLFLFLSFILPVLGEELDTYSDNVLLYNLTEDTYLYEENSSEETFIASLTKLMTALVSINYIDDLDEKVIIKEDDLEGLEEQNASVAGFIVGETVTYRDLLYGLLLPSGADAALALAHNTYKTEDEFIYKMNELGYLIGLRNTHFSTTTGLDDVDNYSTLKDLVILLKYALKNETFYDIFSEDIYTTSDLLLTFKSALYRNSIKNNLNLNYVIGSKTGTTDNAGLCFISYSKYEDVEYIYVSTNAPKSYKIPYHMYDAIKVHEYFFDNYDYVNVFNKGDTILTLDVLDSWEKKVNIICNEDVKIYMDKNIDLGDLEYNYNSLKDIDYNLEKGSKIGTLDIKYKGETLKTIDVFLTSKIHYDYSLIIIICLEFFVILLLCLKQLTKKKISARI